MSDNEPFNGEACDAEARRRIREELDQSFLVEAAAGTGKTTSIVERMVNLVASDTCAIDKLVAVTFTRKAAAELRERFQAELRHRASMLQDSGSPEQRAVYVRLQSASDNVAQAMVGTIHSFAASLLRERPIEFGVDPAFRELDEEEDAELQEQAWQENLNDLFASSDPLIDQLDELGVDREELKQCFTQFIQYRDVLCWPCDEPAEIDLPEYKRQTRAYVDHIKQLMPFPSERGNDELMDCYEEIVRASVWDWDRSGRLFSLLEKFDRSRKVVQKQWHDKAVAKQERDQFLDFRERWARPGMQWWSRKRYQFVVKFVRRAVDVYERLKVSGGALDFTDLLLIAADGLKEQPQLRKYFQSRFSHLLVDEFQDTDPIQAEMILFLASEDVDQRDCFRCQPRRGSLFLVGDPKQSIYRFRRGDIVTYNRVRKIFEGPGGEVLALVKNFRSCDELRCFTNRVFRDKFRAASKYGPPNEDMVQGRVEKHAGVLEGVRQLRVEADRSIQETTEREAESIARFIHDAIACKLTVGRSERDLRRGRGKEVEARDFLIITRMKKRIDLFKEALDRYGVPCEVTGGNAFSNVRQLGVLIQCLRAIDDPHHPVHYLTLLRERLLAFRDDELYEFQSAGGKFSFTAKVPEELRPPLKERFEKANAKLRRYQTWLRAMPLVTAVHRIAADLGLLALTAAESEGNVVLGGFLKAIELLRNHARDFDSVSDLIGFFERIDSLQETEGGSALAPNPNVVRVMNLHKAKGLEAPIVFLADTCRPFRPDPTCHIDRDGDEPRGYMGIQTDKGKWARREVATPENWGAYQTEEKRFLDAEGDRLLYVATTRAASMLVVSVGDSKSNWAGLHASIQDADQLVFPEATCATAAHLSSKATTGDQQSPVHDKISDRWARVQVHGYRIESVKESARKEAARPTWQTTGEYGVQWGLAIHELLELAAKTKGEDLRRVAARLVTQYELGSQRLDELLATANSVIRSNIWQRAHASKRCFSELPFEVPSFSRRGQPVIARGVIDLIFEESEGWIIVDYKTDDIKEGDLSDAVSHHRPQLNLYARHWSDVTGERVVEQGLYFTRIDRYQVIDDGS